MKDVYLFIRAFNAAGIIDIRAFWLEFCAYFLDFVNFTIVFTLKLKNK